MSVLILGLVIFLGVHSTRIVADEWRSTQIERRGEKAWKGIYTVLSLIGFALIIWGFGIARGQTVVLYTPPLFLRHIASLLILIAFVLLTAAYIPRNGIKARLHHPMMLGVKTWAFAHLLTNGRLAGVVLFGAFLLWSILAFSAARKRDARAGTTYPPGTLAGTMTTIIVGVVAWAIFAFWLHRLLIGVAPFAAMAG